MVELVDRFHLSLHKDNGNTRMIPWCSLPRHQQTRIVRRGNLMPESLSIVGAGGTAKLVISRQTGSAAVPPAP